MNGLPFGEVLVSFARRTAAKSPPWQVMQRTVGEDEKTLTGLDAVRHRLNQARAQAPSVPVKVPHSISIGAGLAVGIDQPAEAPDPPT